MKPENRLYGRRAELLREAVRKTSTKTSQRRMKNTDKRIVGNFSALLGSLLR